MAGYAGPEPMEIAPGEFKCGAAGCTATFPTPQGTKAHWSRTHKSNEQAAIDDLFERSGSALQAMFPEVKGFPWSRTIELGRLQEQIIKVLGRDA